MTNPAMTEEELNEITLKLAQWAWPEAECGIYHHKALVTGLDVDLVGVEIKHHIQGERQPFRPSVNLNDLVLLYPVLEEKQLHLTYLDTLNDLLGRSGARALDYHDFWEYLMAPLELQFEAMTSTMEWEINYPKMPKVII